MGQNQGVPLRFLDLRSLLYLICGLVCTAKVDVNLVCKTRCYVCVGTPYLYYLDYKSCDLDCKNCDLGYKQYDPDYKNFDPYSDPDYTNLDLECMNYDYFDAPVH